MSGRSPLQVVLTSEKTKATANIVRRNVKQCITEVFKLTPPRSTKEWCEKRRQREFWSSDGDEEKGAVLNEYI